MSYRPPRFELARVHGVSMWPTLREGDLLLVRRAARPRIGSVVLVRLPPDADGGQRPIAVKRVTGRDPADPSRWWVERDNPRSGVDSWLVGSLADADVLGRVICRLWPTPRLLRVRAAQ